MLFVFVLSNYPFLYLCPVPLSESCLSLCLLTGTDLVSGLLGLSTQLLGGEKLHLSLLTDLC